MNLGVYRGSGQPVAVAGYETWLGRHVGHVTEFIGRMPDGVTNPWQIIDNPGWYIGQWDGTPWTPVFSLAAIPCHFYRDSSGASHPLTLEDGAAGKYDQHLRNFANSLKSHGLTNPVIRLPWEHRVKSYPWYAVGHESAYVAYCKRIVTIVRSVVAGARFDYCYLPGGGVDVAATYPGDEYVDTVGCDPYDQVGSIIDPVKRWDAIMNGTYGLAWLATFAARHGKPMTLTEWGCSDQVWNGVRYGGGDSPTYVANMLAWIASHDVAWANYFEVNAGDGNHRLMPGSWVNFPNAAAKFRQVVQAAP